MRIEPSADNNYKHIHTKDHRQLQQLSYSSDITNEGRTLVCSRGAVAGPKPGWTPPLTNMDTYISLVFVFMGIILQDAQCQHAAKELKT